ncbi:hypothetical protein OG976_06620 [Mycobacterium sp. NBC_00419]|uniref:hypothetical protein n=1 Tax=Mycobacterium sp. NBC_00419 TaxID=2975989 RepID=UPI002E1EC77A
MRADVFDLDEGVTTRSQRAPRCARYELDVLGTDVADVVAGAGGWLFDRVMAGWEVTVAVPDGVDAGPLRILGVHTAAAHSLYDGRPAGRALAVSGPLCNADDSVRDAVGAALRSSRTEVTLWGAPWVPALGSRGAEVRHELSSAARMFKAQALAAAGAGATVVTSFETFFSHGRPVRTDYPDLLPVS